MFGTVKGGLVMLEGGIWTRCAAGGGWVSPMPEQIKLESLE